MQQGRHFVNVIQDRNATVAEWVGEGVVATGSAKREPGEPFDSQVGIDLAVSRALMNAARQIEERAMTKLAEIEAEYAKKVVEAEVVGGADYSLSPAEWKMAGRRLSLHDGHTVLTPGLLTPDEINKRIKAITDFGFPARRPPLVSFDCIEEPPLRHRRRWTLRRRVVDL